MSRPPKPIITSTPRGSRLTFIRFTTDRHENWKSCTPIGLYRCYCGVEKEISIYEASRGRTISCGCIVVEIRKSEATHGLSKHPLYRVWDGVIKRCENKNMQAYPQYGGKGVKICEEWRNDFKKFYDWSIANGWRKGLQIDKDKKAIENGVQALLYSPEFCCFLTPKENSNSRISNRLLSYNGRTQTMSYWTEELGFRRHTIKARLRLKWSVEKALSTTEKIKKYEGNKI